MRETSGKPQKHAGVRSGGWAGARFRDRMPSASTGFGKRDFSFGERPPGRAEAG
jgi:hypothetical protein